MDSNFIEQLQHIKLTTEEGEIIKVRLSQREKIIKECSLSLFGVPDYKTNQLKSSKKSTT